MTKQNHQNANKPAGISNSLKRKIPTHYGCKDAIGLHERPAHDWGGAETVLSTDMTTEEIENKFQLLSNDHSLQKRRACEQCFKTGKRGTPFGIKFFYGGGENWPKNVPPTGPEAEAGCVGCGWYDFAKWREALNLKLSGRKAASYSAKQTS